MDNKNFSFYAVLNVKDLYRELKTDENGLSQEEANKRLTIYGRNENHVSDIAWWTILMRQIRHPFIVMFVIIASVYFFTNQITESIVLIVIMCVNTVIGFYQEYHSNKAMEILQSYLRTSVMVRRAGADISVAVNKLVPGDVLIITAGDIIPADCRLVKVENLMINQASLTGESVPVKKTDIPIEGNLAHDLYKAENCCFAGTVVADGEGVAVVFATGPKTELGSIVSLAAHTIIKSNVTKGTAQLAKIVLLLVLVSLLFMCFIHLLIKKDTLSWLNILLFSSALAISAIPSALPIVITFCLTKSAMTLHKHKMIVKRLSAIEDLGNLEVLCMDKTGTLTENSLRVSDLYEREIDNSLIYASLSAAITKDTDTAHTFDAAIRQKLTDEEKKIAALYTIVQDLPFTYERHRAVVLVKKGNEYWCITKGSAEYVITQCPHLTKDELQELNSWIKEKEMQGDRVLAVAIKSVSVDHITEDLIKQNDTTYDRISLISFSDPLKSTADAAVKKAQSLGVQIKVLSGDSAYVCFAIAQKLGLETDMNNVVHGADFENSREEQKMFLVNNRSIFARITPEQKYQIIAYLQDTYSVGYLGDGINDAPALKIANVGIAVSDAACVAREEAEIILLQKSLFNVVLGLQEGRRTIINALKYIKVSIASNIGNFYALTFSSLLIDYFPMLPVQLLFLDLITDFPLIAISTDAVGNDELKKPLPYSMKEIGLTVLFFGMMSLPFYAIVLLIFKERPAILRTSWFMVSAFMQLTLVFSLRTKKFFLAAKAPSFTLFSLSVVAALVVVGLPYTDFGKKVFFFESPSTHDLLIIFSLVFVYFSTIEIVKIFYYRVRKN